MTPEESAARRARVEKICAARFPVWDTMNDKTKDQYRRQAEFWMEAVDKADGESGQ